MLAPAELLQAAEDLRWLLSRGYPRDASITLVGNRYGLPKPLREILKRGVMSPEVAESRRMKAVDPSAIRGERLALDGHNVLITLRSALRGETVLWGDDGFLRDIAGVSAGFKMDEYSRRALELTLQDLLDLRPSEVLFLLDAPMSRSRELARAISAELQKRGLKGRGEAVPVPERILKGFEGIVCSGDGDVIDNARRVFDLAGHIVRQRGICQVLRLKD